VFCGRGRQQKKSPTRFKENSNLSWSGEEREEANWNQQPVPEQGIQIQRLWDVRSKLFEAPGKHEI
jgi:hypothetical protein